MRRYGQNRVCRSRRGLLEIEILAGLVLVAALAAALTAVLGRQHRAALKLADTRAAAQVAEAVLADLQSGRAVRSVSDVPDATLEIRPAGDEPAGAAGAGEVPERWVEVAVSIRRGRAALVGLVPRGAPLPQAGGAP